VSKLKLSKSMTEDEFDHGYWYAVEVKAFAVEIGIRHAARLRKDELQDLIKHFLRTGRVKTYARAVVSNTQVRDVEKGLKLTLPIVNYTNNAETKAFLLKEALRRAPKLKQKSGARYRLNRWREEQIANGIPITYGDLVKQYIKLNEVEGRFPQAGFGYYVNFLSDFLRLEKDARRTQAIRAWKEVKELDVPNTYRDWKRYRESKRA
jgi:SAP domain-containing new25